MSGSHAVGTRSADEERSPGEPGGDLSLVGYLDADHEHLEDNDGILTNSGGKFGNSME